MSNADLLRAAFASIEVAADFGAATVTLTDGSLLEFCHRVSERWARVPEGTGDEAAARQILAAIQQFRLNAKHLDIFFQDGSRWEAGFR
ncbi:MAG: hypothetical protein AB7K24_11265 [Gemmataceae bacterium]